MNNFMTLSVLCFQSMLFNPSLGQCVAATKLKESAFIEMRMCDTNESLMQIDQDDGFHF
jgi:hypothetical protein